MTLLVMTAVLIAGMTSLSLSGDYVYFGVMRQTLSVRETMLAAPVAGVLGGLMGAFFSRAVLVTGRTRWAPAARLRARPVLFAGILGVIVAGIGVASELTWGTGYGAARAIITGADVPHWSGSPSWRRRWRRQCPACQAASSRPRSPRARASATCCAGCSRPIRPARSCCSAWSPISPVSSARR